jgi:hypothetical protein
MGKESGLAVDEKPLTRGSKAVRQWRHIGYRGLLNLRAQPHCTVFLSDFALSSQTVRHLQGQLEAAPTRLLFVRTDYGLEHVMGELRAAGVDPSRDYLSLQGVVVRQESVLLLNELFESLPRRDLSRVELPLRECGFRRAFATRLMQVVSSANYAEQDWISDHFFQMLALRKPYRVTVITPEGKLEIRDSEPWFNIAGQLREDETRIIPGGEVSYTGDAVEGTFVVDGAILPLPEHPAVAHEARLLGPISRKLKDQPLCIRIRSGRVVQVSGEGSAPKILSKLFETDDRYRRVTEVGISFNRACDAFIHNWPAASNEARPGVHLGIGGDPTRNDGAPARGRPLVHIDCMAANCQVFVNGRRFLRASS